MHQRAVEALAAILRCEKVNVAVHVLGSRTVECEQSAVARGKHRHTTAAARACGLAPGGSFRPESLSLIGGSSPPNLPAGSPWTAPPLFSIPCHENFAAGVGPDGPTT